MSTQLIKPNYLVILPPTQHHSFFRNLPPLYREALPEMGTFFRGSPYNGLYGEALPKRGTFFRGTPYSGLYMRRLCLKGVSFFRAYAL